MFFFFVRRQSLNGQGRDIQLRLKDVEDVIILRTASRKKDSIKIEKNDVKNMNNILDFQVIPFKSNPKFGGIIYLLSRTIGFMQETPLFF